MLSNLSSKKCVPCASGTLAFKPEDIIRFNQQLTKPWEVIGSIKLKKDFNFKDFKQTMRFVNKVADIAEQEQHHPDIHIFYNKVTIELWTHAIGGLSENDFILAAKCDSIIV